MAGPVYVRQVGDVTVTLHGDNHGLNRLLRDPMLFVGLVPHAEAIKARAEATAPRGRDPRAGRRYAESFGVETYIGANREGHVRAAARVTNSSRHALYLEYGNDRTPAYRILRKAAGQISFVRDKGVHGG